MERELRECVIVCLRMYILYILRLYTSSDASERASMCVCVFVRICASDFKEREKKTQNSIETSMWLFCTNHTEYMRDNIRTNLWIASIHTGLATICHYTYNVSGICEVYRYFHLYTLYTKRETERERAYFINGNLHQHIYILSRGCGSIEKLSTNALTSHMIQNTQAEFPFQYRAIYVCIE